ncbi:MAG: hypothetical protein IKZ34_03705 [Alphaproteobacteria bacterium]|nr:hypothetical protein [Alphaproteobacteria bacterium]
MKKMLFLLPVIALAGCDSATSDVELSCEVDKYWSNVNALYLKNAYGDFDTNDTKINVKVTTYEDYAKVTVDNITTVFEKVIEAKDHGEFGYVRLSYKGNFPGSERTALLSIYADIADKQILQYDLNFIGEKTTNAEGREYSIGHFCQPVKEEYIGRNWSAKVPFNHNYKMPNKIERCINDITKKIYCMNTQCNQLALQIGVEHIVLTQKDALLLSQNWDYSNMKLYQNDGVIEDHEKDACEVLYKINQFIYSDSKAVQTVRQAIKDCGDECAAVLAEGKRKDFLIRVPATEDLYKITNKPANAKFLSVNEAQQYVQDGYCLINVVPLASWKLLGKPERTCNYRVYCGSANLMSSDEFYAVELCEE